MFAALGIMLVALGVTEILPAHWRESILGLRAASTLLALAVMLFALTGMHNNMMRIIFASLMMVTIGLFVGVRCFDRRQRARRF